VNKYISLLLLIGLSFAQEITIAVLDFEGKGVSQSETSTLTDRLRDEIFKTGIYIVLERGKMDEVLKEQGFQQTGCITSECAVEVGRMLGVQQMVAGSIGKVGTVYTVSARIFDVQTGKILKSANYDLIGDIGQLLLKGMSAVVQQLITGQSSNNQIEISTPTRFGRAPYTGNVEVKQAMPKFKVLSIDEIKLQAKNAAHNRHNRAIYNAAGVASCFIYPVGLPVAILYTESGVASNMNPNEPVYFNLDSTQKMFYKKAYKQEEKRLRRKSIYGAEGFCVVLFYSLYFLLLDD